MKNIIQKQPPEGSYKQDVLENFAIFKRKHNCVGVSFNKVASFRPAASLKKTSTQGAFL